jgi:hypothetical protein
VAIALAHLGGGTRGCRQLHERRDRVLHAGDQGRPRPGPVAADHRPWQPRPALHGARGVPQGGPLLRPRHPGGRRRPGDVQGGRRRGRRGDRRRHGRDRRLRAVVRARRGRPDRGARGAGDRTRRVAARRRVRRRLAAALPAPARSRGRAVRPVGARRHLAVGRPAQVRVLPEGRVAGALPRPRGAPPPAVRLRRLDRLHGDQPDDPVEQDRRGDRSRVGDAAPHR